MEKTLVKRGPAPSHLWVMFGICSGMRLIQIYMFGHSFDYLTAKQNTDQLVDI